MGEPHDSLSLLPEHLVDFIELLHEVMIDGTQLSVHQMIAAHFDNYLRCPFEHQQFRFGSVVLMNAQLPLVLAVEGDLEDLVVLIAVLHRTIETLIKA